MFLATHGVLRRSSAFVPPVFADTYSFEYDGVSDYVITDNAFNNLSSGTAMTVSVWFKSSTYTTSGRLIYVGKHVEILQNSSLYGNTRGTFTYKVLGNFGNSFATMGGNTQSGVSNLVDGNWHHICITWEGSTTTAVVYEDGVAKITNTSASGTLNSSTTEKLSIGSRNTGSNPIEGLIDEPAVFDYALTSSQVLDIFSAGTPDTIASLNPVGHWRAENATFDGSNWNITDAGSGGNNATSVSMTSASRSTDVPLFDNKSFEYDGVSDYLEISNPIDLSFGNSVTDSSFSISTWWKMSDYQNFRGFQKIKNDNSAPEYRLNTVGSGLLKFTLYDSSIGNFIGVASTTNLSSYEDVWVHIVATYDGSSSNSGMKIYIDGSILSTSGESGGNYVAMHSFTSDVKVGKLNDLGSTAEGLINEPAVFDYELTSTEVSSIYGSGVPTDISSLNPVGHWRAENGSWDGSKWTITDSGSGGNDAESVSMTLASRTSDVPT